MRVYVARDVSGDLALFQNQPINEGGTFYPDEGDCWVIGVDGEPEPETFSHVAPGECVECCLVVGDRVDFSVDPAAVATA